MDIRREIQLVQMHFEEAYNHFNTLIQEWEHQAKEEALLKNQAERQKQAEKEALVDYEDKADYLKWKKTQNIGQTRRTTNYEETTDEPMQVNADEMKELQNQKRVL